MPKRDAAYMDDQREAIVEATLGCMVELGVAGTSMRAVATRAGVTTGAVYVHFDNREDLIVAAAMSQPMFAYTPVDTWADFIGRIRTAIDELDTNARYRSMQRAMFELIGSIDLAGRSIPALDAHVDAVAGFVRQSLATLNARGEVTLPLGLETTVQMVLQLINGASLSLFAPRARAAEVSEVLVAALAHGTGYRPAE